MTVVEKSLELRNITKRFPGIVANDAISLAIDKGEIHAIVGENGAGKSTLMNMITGLYQPDEGEICVREKVLRFHGPRDAIQQGIGMVHQHFKLVERFNGLQNIILGHEKSSKGVISFTQAAKEVQELCDLYHFMIELQVPVGELSVGQQQRIEILKVLYRGADILIFDEPTAVLAPSEVADLFENLRRLKAQGKTILFISHKLEEVLAIADQVTVLRRGRLISTVEAKDTDKIQLAELMVGKQVSFQFEKPQKAAGPAILEVKALTMAGKGGRHSLDQVSLTVKAGEIFGIAGVEGSGQSELVSAIMGLEPYSGKVFLKGEPLAMLNTQQLRKMDIGYIPEDRHAGGLVLPLSVWGNMVLGQQRDIGRTAWWRLDMTSIRQVACEKVQEYDIRLSDMQTSIKHLSGGNQQKVIIAREMRATTQLIIAVQPVRGLDIGASNFVYQQLLAARNHGKAILVISADLDEILSLSDRVAIMYSGRLVKEFIPGELTVGEIGQYMLGVRKSVVSAC